MASTEPPASSSSSSAPSHGRRRRRRHLPAYHGSTIFGQFGVQNAVAAQNAYMPVLMRRRLVTPSAAAPVICQGDRLDGHRGRGRGRGRHRRQRAGLYPRHPRGGGGIRHGLPRQPVLGQRFFRTDLAPRLLLRRHALVDGHRVPRDAGPGFLDAGDLCRQQHRPHHALVDAFDLWLETLYSSTYVATTNDGTKFWTIALQKAVANDTKTGIVSFNTSADTVNQWTRRGTAIGALYAAATYFEMDVQATKTRTPGTLFWAIALRYRLIVT